MLAAIHVTRSTRRPQRENGQGRITCAAVQLACACAAYSDDEAGLWIARAKGGDFASAPPELLGPHPRNVNHLDLLPDGSRFLAVRTVPDPPRSARVEAALNWVEELKGKATATGR